MKRRRVRGPREFTNLGSFDMDVGWAYDLERNDETQTISVIVAGGISGRSGMAEESPRAISTKGRSAVDGVLDRDEPPRYILVTTAGLGERQSE